MQEIILTREELYHQVWAQTLSSLAHKYMRTEMSLRTLCIEIVSIPVPREGHWEKIRAGKKIDPPPLSANYQDSATIKLPIREPKKKRIFKKMSGKKNSKQKRQFLHWKNRRQ